MSPLALFAGYGIECEYMVVDKSNLVPKPIADKVLTDLAGELCQEAELGSVAWSNELVLHVLELKGNGPSKDLVAMQADFQRQISNVNAILAKYDAMLMPTAMHPTLDPLRDTKLWPHGDKAIYEAYNRIFSCQGHGWANLQSVHINLPFANDNEFGRLHAAIRLALPLLPAIAASSPIYDGHATGKLDNRLFVYKNNQIKVPSITGQIIPEAVFTQNDYEVMILGRLFRDIAPFDPEGILQHEWLNSRGAIARFDRNAVEIRVLDIQECLQADFAVIAAVVSLVHALVDEVFISYEEQMKWSTEDLVKIFLANAEGGEQSIVRNQRYAKIFGFPVGRQGSSYLDVWAHLGDVLSDKYEMPNATSAFKAICDHGSLAQRILRAQNDHRRSIEDIYLELSDCLAQNRMFGI